MWNRKGIRHPLGSGLAAFLFWGIVGITIHVWVPHGQDSAYNINQVEHGRIIFRLVHFSYILAGYSFFKTFHWLHMTALQALAIVSVLSLAVGGWAVFKIGCHFGGRTLGWPMSFLVLPLPLVMAQAQGQEYQPFATGLMLLAWYCWTVRKSVPTTAISWATSVLANPANAVLFPSFISFSLLESGSITAALRRSVRLWVVSAALVIAAWGPFYKELLTGQWGVAPVMSLHLSSLFGFLNLSRASAFLLYSVLSNFYIFVFAIPFKKLKQALAHSHAEGIDHFSRGKVFTLLLSILVSTCIVAIVLGSQGHGRYYTPILLWVALMLLMGIVRVLPDSELGGIVTRWRWAGVVQFVFVIFVIALPYKYKVYARYRDYHFVADKYSHFVVAEIGALGFRGFNLREKHFEHLFYLGSADERDELNSMLTSGQINQFILVYDAPSRDRALMKKLLPNQVVRRLGVLSREPEDMLRHMGFDVALEPLGRTVSGNVFLAERAPRNE